MHRAGDREVFIRHRRAVLISGKDVERRLNVDDDYADVKRDAALGDDLSRHLIDDHLLVARGIKTSEKVDRELWMFGKFAGEGRRRAVVVLLQGYDAARGSRALDDEVKGRQQSRRLPLHQLLVHAKQRLAFRAVDDYGAGLGPQLDVGRKAGAAGSHYPRL